MERESDGERETIWGELTRIWGECFHLGYALILVDVVCTQGHRNSLREEST